MRLKNKREKIIAAVTGAVLGLLLLDQVLIDPLMNSQLHLDKDIAKAQVQHDRDQKILNKAMLQDKQWRSQMRGAIPADYSAADKQLVDNLQLWSQQSNIVITVMGSARSEKEKELVRVTRPVTLTGNMEQLRSFLWQIQTATIPVRIVDITIMSKPEGTDNLSVTMSLSTLARSPETPDGMPELASNAKEASR